MHVQIEANNTLERMRVIEIRQKISHNLIVEQTAKQRTISCQLLHEWRLSYV